MSESFDEYVRPATTFDAYGREIEAPKEDVTTATDASRTTAAWGAAEGRRYQSAWISCEKQLRVRRVR